MMGECWEDGQVGRHVRRIDLWRVWLIVHPAKLERRWLVVSRARRAHGNLAPGHGLILSIRLLSISTPSPITSLQIVRPWEKQTCLQYLR